MSSEINFGITQYGDKIIELPETLSSLLNLKELQYLNVGQNFHGFKNGNQA